ncbi:dirigent protein 21-like [Rhodamnia argentea]|uniref:Dirigent protein n=1 Tax=Rhodamnia argentea TaxID=178133 RepID=A0A8B8NLI2_9MYRT|nr:dirigent protein 21-like [Rhodamnia argentea]
MAKLGLIAMGAVALALVATAATLARAKSDDPEKVNAWFRGLSQPLSHAKHKTTHLHFYLHDTLSGKSPTVVRAAEAAMTKTSPTLFGAVNILDDPLTEGPELASPLVGWAQWFYALTGLKSMALLMYMNLVFTSLDHNGSTLSMLGRNPPFEFQTYQEMPIVGGTGVFQLASGIATAKTYFFNSTTGDAVVEYNVISVHY